MFEKFTERARRVMGVARQEAERLGHDYIGTEHILLGLVRQGAGIAANILEDLGIDIEEVRLEVKKRVKQGPNMVTLAHLPFTPRGKRALELAYEEARGMGHEWVGTEHLLLGLLRGGQGVAVQVLVDLGVKYDELRGEVLEVIGPGPPPDEGEKPLECTGDFRRVLGMAHEEARALQHDCVGAEHLLLGLVRGGDGIAARILADAGLKYEEVKNKVADLIGPGPAPEES